jgi:hypothetical protein
VYCVRKFSFWAISCVKLSSAIVRPSSRNIARSLAISYALFDVRRSCVSSSILTYPLGLRLSGNEPEDDMYTQIKTDSTETAVLKHLKSSTPMEVMKIERGDRRVVVVFETG